MSASEVVGPYRILTKLGEGGMGEVYLAEDTRLGRRVALKFLSQIHANENEIKTRFFREARSASSLNHPSIVTIYDIVKHNNSDVIAMEFVEGQSLRTLITNRSLDLKRSLEICAQIASALAAAHHAGIIHRDIKPENVMIGKNNSVKVLDFGVAKMLFNQSVAGSQMSTLPEALPTRSGVIIGTVAYMSPEQARGEEVDGRSDIFSLGCMLYEMVSGKRPFLRPTAIETLHAITNENPGDPRQFNPALPPALSDIVEKALAKNPTERYQHIGDFELDLRRLRRSIDAGTGITAQAAETNSIWKYVTMALIAVVAFASGFVVATRKGPEPQLQPDPFAEINLNPLTVDSGFEGNPTFSPDGETIAYVSDRTGNFEIFLKQVSGGPEINLTNHAGDDVQPAFSPDGKQIAFISTRSSKLDLHYPGPDSPEIGGDLWVMSAFGGSPRKIAENANFPSWTPDGQSILYCSGILFDPKIYKVSSAGGSPSEIPLDFQNARPPRVRNVHLSSDGKWILFQTGNRTRLVSSKGGKPQMLLKGSDPVWNSAAGTIIFSSTEAGKNFSLFEVPFSSTEGKLTGIPKPLTFGTGRHVQASVSQNGKRIAFSTHRLKFHVEVLPFDAEAGQVRGEPTQVTSGNDLIYFMNFSPDGRSIVFESRRGSTSHIWRVTLGSAAEQLTSDPQYEDQYPRYSPDGSMIAFARRKAGDADGLFTTWLMSADGANQRLIDTGDQPRVSAFFAWLPSRNALVLKQDTDRQFHLLDLGTNQNQAITNEGNVDPICAASPDGKWLVYSSALRGDTDIRGIPVSGGKSIEVVATPRKDYHPFFSPSGMWLYFQPDHKNFYRVPGPAQNWRKAEPQKVTDFSESGLYLDDPQFSPDGKQLLYSKGHLTADIWLLQRP